MHPVRIVARALSLAVFMTAAAAAHAQEIAIPTSSPAHDVSMDEYKQHLVDLGPVVEACAKARDEKNCDPSLVGLDDRVPLKNGERRLIRYDWLRALMTKAQVKEDAAKPKETKPEPPDPLLGINKEPAGTRPPKRTTEQLLGDATARLKQDLAEANGASAPLPAHEAERGQLDKVLAGREFRNVQENSIEDTFLEKIVNSINNFFNKVARWFSHFKWVGEIVKWGFLGAICVGLVWGLIQLERRWRFRLAPEMNGPAPDAASARDWQLWLEDARRAAAAGKWREAVHFVYWASISRLESKRLWPADRARTPREYLALVAEEDPRKAGLTMLTRSFERIWYGGRAAGEGDYRAAEELATALIAGGGAA